MDSEKLQKRAPSRKNSSKKTRGARSPEIPTPLRQVGFRRPITISIGDDKPMLSTQKFLRHAIEPRSKCFHCSIFAGYFTSLSTVQSYLCDD
jgi:hypothetical protein